MVRDLDIYCSKSHCSFSNTFTTSKAKTQGTTIKKPCIEESRLKKTKPANEKFFFTPCINEFVKSIYQEKKYWKKKQDQKNSFPATGDNTIKDSG